MFPVIQPGSSFLQRDQRAGAVTVAVPCYDQKAVESIGGDACQLESQLEGLEVRPGPVGPGTLFPQQAPGKSSAWGGSYLSFIISDELSDMALAVMQVVFCSRTCRSSVVLMSIQLCCWVEEYQIICTAAHITGFVMWSDFCVGISTVQTK